MEVVPTSGIAGQRYFFCDVVDVTVRCFSVPHRMQSADGKDSLPSLRACVLVWRLGLLGKLMEVEKKVLSNILLKAFKKHS